MKNIVVGLIILLIAMAEPVFAAKGEPIDLQYRYNHYYTTFQVNKDGTVVESRAWSMTVLKDTALRWMKQSSITYSTSVQHAEVIEAYTRKADGKRIDVPKDNYQTEVNGGKGKDAPVYSDQTTLTVVFPDLAVGDTVVFSFRISQTEPLFPGHFSLAETFGSQDAFDDVRVRIDYPASLWAQYEAHGMKEEEHEQGDRKVVEWTYANPRPVKNERRDYSVYDPDRETGFAFSTFRSYEEIAAAYGARAQPKAAVTERIQNLADNIVKGRTVVRDQAHALYDWVATHITYAGNCIGVGAVVPHDLTFVLDNRMGDCKDHATLLQALLAARGIRSTQALVNAGSVYRLAKIPVVSTINHVINYIPALDLYVDSTSDSTPFGMLPFQDEDKPVLLTEGYRDGAKTPTSPAGTNWQVMKSVLKLSPDGSIAGMVEVFQKGHGAADMRAAARQMTKEVEEDFVKNMFRERGKIGSGKLEKDDPTPLADTYHYKASLRLERFAKRPGAGAFGIHPLLSSPAPIHTFLTSSMEPEEGVDMACTGGTSTEEYVIELPKAMKILSIPDDFKLANDFLSYTATYRLKGNILTVKRTLDDRTKGNVCSPDVFVAYKKFGERVMDDLQAQVLYNK